MDMGVKVFVSSTTGDMKVKTSWKLNRIYQRWSEVSDPRSLQTLQNQQRIVTILKSLEVDFVQVFLHNVLIVPIIFCSIFCFDAQVVCATRWISLLLVRRAKESSCERKQRFSKLKSIVILE